MASERIAEPRPSPYDSAMEARLRAVEDSIVRIDTKLDAVLPTLATKVDLSELRADMHKSLNDQTWKFIGFVSAIAALLLAGIKLWH